VLIHRHEEGIWWVFGIMTDENFLICSILYVILTYLCC
jgi:hypothetical protein